MPRQLSAASTQRCASSGCPATRTASPPPRTDDWQQRRLLRRARWARTSVIAPGWRALPVGCGLWPARARHEPRRTPSLDARNRRGTAIITWQACMRMARPASRPPHRRS
jgi:hypothetical protein